MHAMRLYVNVDHVATVRQARRTDEPDPVEAARLAVAGGADGITVHLREDRRHIQDHDVHRLAAAMEVPINLELAAHGPIVELAVALRPHQATLVPERREEVTTEGGLDLSRDDPGLRDAIARLRDAGIRVSLFIDPTPAAVERSAALGVPAIELHTGGFAEAWPGTGEALAALRCRKEVAIVPGATHLFEEPGALEQVAALAGDWFAGTLQSGRVAAPSSALTSA